MVIKDAQLTWNLVYATCLLVRAVQPVQRPSTVGKSTAQRHSNEGLHIMEYKYPADGSQFVLGSLDSSIKSSLIVSAAKQGIPVDSLFDILDGIAAVEGPHSVSLRSSKQHSAGA